MGVFVPVCMCVGFEVGVSVGCGFALCLGYECVWPGPCAYLDV
jgi:hypothetical protein